MDNIIIKNDSFGCKRCGHCCYYMKYENNIPQLKKCKHLVRFSSGRTLCRMYHKALLERTKNGHCIDRYTFNNELKLIFCVWRNDGMFNYTGCPFNIDGLPLFDDYIESIGLKVPWKK